MRVKVAGDGLAVQRQCETTQNRHRNCAMWHAKLSLFFPLPLNTVPFSLFLKPLFSFLSYFFFFWYSAFSFLISVLCLFKNGTPVLQVDFVQSDPPKKLISTRSTVLFTKLISAHIHLFSLSPLIFSCLNIKRVNFPSRTLSWHQSCYPGPNLNFSSTSNSLTSSIPRKWQRTMGETWLIVNFLVWNVQWSG